MTRDSQDYKEPTPHADRPRMYRLGKWVTECRLARGWTMVDVAIQLHNRFPRSRLGNQGRISELETGNGVTRERWTPEIVDFLYSIFKPCPPPPEDPWALSEAYIEFQEEQAAAKAARQAEIARRQGLPQPGLDVLWSDDEAPVASGDQLAPAIPSQ